MVESRSGQKNQEIVQISSFEEEISCIQLILTVYEKLFHFFVLKICQCLLTKEISNYFILKTVRVLKKL